MELTETIINLKKTYKTFLISSFLFVLFSTPSLADVVSKSKKTTCGSIEVLINYSHDSRDFTGYGVELIATSLKVKSASAKLPFPGVYFRSKCLTNPKGKKYFIFQAYCIGSSSSCNDGANYGIIETYYPKVRLVPSPNNKELAEKIFKGPLPLLRNEADVFFTQ